MEYGEIKKQRDFTYFIYKGLRWFDEM